MGKIPPGVQPYRKLVFSMLPYITGLSVRRQNNPTLSTFGTLDLPRISQSYTRSDAGEAHNQESSPNSV